jgi:hypothetical protein
MAACSLIIFMVLQIPFFLAHTPNSSTGMLALSPLQVVSGNLARVYPKFAPYAEAALLPGTWVSYALRPYLVCLHTHGLRSNLCEREASHLSDVAWVHKRSNLQRLVTTLDAASFEERPALTYGSALILLSSFAALITTIKTALVGYALLVYGIFKGGHDPMPPLVLTAFLVVYTTLGLDKPKQAPAGQPQQQRQGARSNGQQQQQQVVKQARSPGGRSSKKHA